jgi:hypothetical protein
LVLVETLPSPYADFDAVAAVLQRKDVMEVSLAAVGKAWSALSSSGVLHAMRLGGGAAAGDDDDALAGANPGLRPAMARSGRTFLSALLFAYHPHDILVTDGLAADDAAVAAGGRKQAAADAAVVACARAMLGAFEALAHAVEAGAAAAADSGAAGAVTRPCRGHRGAGRCALVRHRSRPPPSAPHRPAVPRKQPASRLRLTVA